MAIAAELRNERGERIGRLPDPSGGAFDAAGDFDGVLPLAEALSPPAAPYLLLRYVDPYGHTVFNQLQMDDLLCDIDIAQPHASSDVERRGLDRLRMIFSAAGARSACTCGLSATDGAGESRAAMSVRTPAGPAHPL